MNQETAFRELLAGNNITETMNLVILAH